MATRAHLLGYRKDLADLRTAEQILRRMNLDATEVQREIQKLADWILPVEVLCMSCGGAMLVPTPVDDPRGDIPAGCICGPCDEKSESF